MFMLSQASFFDVPLHHNFHQASQAGAQYDLRRILDNTIVQKRPGDAVTFVDNHEYVRYGSAYYASELTT